MMTGLVKLYLQFPGRDHNGLHYEERLPEISVDVECHADHICWSILFTPLNTSLPLANLFV